MFYYCNHAGYGDVRVSQKHTKSNLARNYFSSLLFTLLGLRNGVAGQLIKKSSILKKWCEQYLIVCAFMKYYRRYSRIEWELKLQILNFQSNFKHCCTNSCYSFFCIPSSHRNRNSFCGLLTKKNIRISIQESKNEPSTASWCYYGIELITLWKTVEIFFRFFFGEGGFGSRGGIIMRDIFQIQIFLTEMYWPNFLQIIKKVILLTEWSFNIC